MRLNTFLIAGGAAFAALSSVPAVAGAPAAQDALYGGKAIASGQYADAEQTLKAMSYTDARDPGRLINLATVYMQTQRFDKARATLQQVRQLPDESLVLAGGVSFTSHAIATAMLSRLP
ncbi:MAG: tetratricopeptide repeat protein [Sphingobium sp.]|nr:tetratricopeptide repeat protein [Sphingobium sp.]